MTPPPAPRRSANDIPCPAAPFQVATHSDTGAGAAGPLLLWRMPEPVRAISSGMLGGGFRHVSWIINAHVRADYGRMDPAAHLRDIAMEHGLDSESGVGLMTTARLENVATAVDGPAEAQVRCDATVGVSYPTWAAAPDGEALPDLPWRPGTINIVCQIAVPLTDAALVGAVITTTEAKTQALLDGGVPGTGTASDAIVICCPTRSGAATAIPFTGPRSVWGARLARAVYAAVTQGLHDYAP